MQKSVAPLFFVLLVSSPFANAGVVMDLVTTNVAGKETERSRIYTQSGKMRMEQLSGEEASATMIFLGDRFLYIDHREKSYIVMDEAMLDEVNARVSEAMKEMEAQLANMPPEQRAMVEQMMKGRMQDMMAGQASPGPAPRVEAAGSSKWKSYACEQYAVYEGAEKVQDVCAARLDEVDGAEEVIETFRAMAAYITKLTESISQKPDGGMDVGKLMDRIDGFPVHTVDYANGVVSSETSMESLAEQDIDAGMFSAPDGYQRRDPFGER